MQFFGLFGEHLSHSYSERIHSTFFDLIGMNAGSKHIALSGRLTLTNRKSIRKAREGLFFLSNLSVIFCVT